MSAVLDIAQLLAAGGVGGIASTMLVNTHERRTARLELLESIRRYEAATPTERVRSRLDQEYVNAALLAGLHQNIVRAFLRSSDIVKVHEIHALSAAEDHRTRPTDETLKRIQKRKRRWEESLQGRDAIKRLQAQRIWHPWLSATTWRLQLLRIPQDVREAPAGNDRSPP